MAAGAKRKKRGGERKEKEGGKATTEGLEFIPFFLARFFSGEKLTSKEPFRGRLE